jgi:flagella basal body P-ring formation protein FlgA
MTLSALPSCLALCFIPNADAGTVRLWPSAVVVEDAVRVNDLCELRGFDPESERSLAQLVVIEAPPAGSARIVHINTVRAVLASGRTNMATTTLSGAMQCEVSHPSNQTPSRPSPNESNQQSAAKERIVNAAGGLDSSGGTVARGSPRGGLPAESATDTLSAAFTLRDSVVQHFRTEFARYRGAPEVVFDRTSEQILDLSGPTYEFNVRRRSAAPIGLCPLEVDVLTAGRTVQTVPLVVQVRMTRQVVVARRTINQGATIAAADLELLPLSFDRLAELGVDDTTPAMGQRSKRVIPAGSLIQLEMLEAVPLVLRGQLVTLTSTAGAVRVVTTAKASQDGLLGEAIKVRAVDDHRVEFDAVVVGPAAVRIGPASPGSPETRLASGSRP